MKLLFIFISILLTNCTLLFAENDIFVTQIEAIQVANNFFSIENDGNLAHNNIQVIEVIDSTNQTKYKSLYIIEKLSGGWIMVAGTKLANPVLAYSYEGSFDYERAKYEDHYFLNEYTKEINFIVTNPPSNNIYVHLWNMYLNKKNNDLNLFSSSDTLKPLIKTKWDQGTPYNLFCPYDTTAKQRTITGCIATALGMIMRYHCYPQTGIGTKKYTHKKYGELYSDFTKSFYQYNLMNKSKSLFTSDVSKEEVAKLMLDCGIACEMDYGVNASGAYSKKLDYALTNYFNYNYQYKTKDNELSENWSNLLKKTLLEGIPIYYIGGKIFSHAFICDGFENDKFHFNFGWGGKSDGYYSIDRLAPNYDFTSGQRAYFDLKPKEVISYEKDKFENNNKFENSANLTPYFKDNYLEEDLTLHDSSDVDYFRITLDTEFKYSFNIKLFDRYNNHDKQLQVAETKIFVFENNSWIPINKDYSISKSKSTNLYFKVELNFHSQIGNYKLAILMEKYEKDFIQFTNFKSDTTFTKKTSISLNWITNTDETLVISAINYNKSPIPYIIEKNYLSSKNTYLINIAPNFPDKKIRYFASLKSDSTVIDSTGIIFSKYIKPSYIQINEPNEFSEYITNNRVDMNWYHNIKENFNIDLFNNDKFHSTIATELNNAESYNWIIDSTIESSEKYQIKISSAYDDEIFDFSDYFIITKNLTSIDGNSNLNGNIYINNKLCTFKINEYDNIIEIRIFNYLGQSINKQKIDNIGHNVYFNVPNGLYFIEFIYKNSKESFSLIVD
jgi:hypothetical protein